MKNQIVPSVIALILFLASCAPATQAMPVINNATATPSPLPTATQTALPTETPTASITPLPTVPTFTPTFDTSAIVTVTPAPKAERLKENPELVPSFPIRTKDNYFIENSIQILQYLNQGGELHKAAERLALAAPEYGGTLFENDVTGDQKPDLIFIDYLEEPQLHIFSCQKGQYQDFTPDVGYKLTGYSTALNVASKDLNANNISDIRVLTSCSRAPLCRSLSILEWDGNAFPNLIEPREIFEGFIQEEITDFNNDGTLELVIQDDVRGDYVYFTGFPWRVSTHIYMWNGSRYALQDVHYAEPEYRFQAVQDADRFVLLQNFDFAMKLYNMTIIDEKLLAYSRELSEHMEWLLWNPLSLGVATQPSPDITEYPKLAAYAYYRIILIHLVQGHESDASTTYNTLQEKFGNDQYGHPYVEMATAFWNAYQFTHKMYDGCAAAIQYAAEHPDILIPLGSDYHGAQSHRYKPEDVCPFR